MTKLKPYMCLNCTDETGGRGKKFWAERPVCSCGVDGKNPEYAGMLRRCVVVHFEPPHPVLKGKGTGKQLCDGRTTKEYDPNREAATGSYDAVTCPDCLAHPQYPGRDAEPGTVPEDADYMV